METSNSIHSRVQVSSHHHWLDQERMYGQVRPLIQLALGSGPIQLARSAAQPAILQMGMWAVVIPEAIVSFPPAVLLTGVTRIHTGSSSIELFARSITSIMI